MLSDLDRITLEAASELVKAWLEVRNRFPTDHPVNAERWLKEAFSKLTDGGPVCSACLVSEYERLR